ncbi:hypothetical protein D9757_012450 [Collybiopsis confluens]|uniref:Uncharacterized protein n=1 Tax=Collybiopsis confluens TaxID=2823264 RepID=A0A8H5D4V2_9AGAR|nr:hypothetical protein D9757_012450 [Collybiopsis confluens]
MLAPPAQIPGLLALVFGARVRGTSTIATGQHPVTIPFPELSLGALNPQPTVLETGLNVPEFSASDLISDQFACN